MSDSHNPQAGDCWSLTSDGGGNDPQYGFRITVHRKLVVLKAGKKKIKYALDGTICSLSRENFPRFLSSFQQVRDQYSRREEVDWSESDMHNDTT